MLVQNILKIFKLNSFEIAVKTTYEKPCMYYIFEAFTPKFKNFTLTEIKRKKN